MSVVNRPQSLKVVLRRERDCITSLQTGTQNKNDLERKYNGRRTRDFHLQTGSISVDKIKEGNGKGEG